VHKQTIEDYFREHPPEKEKEPCSLLILNAITHELITITNETYINAQSVCDLLLIFKHLINHNLLAFKV